MLIRDEQIKKNRIRALASPGSDDETWKNLSAKERGIYWIIVRVVCLFLIIVYACASLGLLDSK